MDRSLTPLPPIGRLLALGLLLSLPQCQRTPLTVSELNADIERYYGKTVHIKGRIRHQLRCRLASPTGRWMTYCGACQMCRGSWLIGRLHTTSATSAAPAEGIIVSGSWQGRRAECEGPINHVDCYPFKDNHIYTVTGLLERSTPPRLYLDHFEELP